MNDHLPPDHDEAVAMKALRFTPPADVRLRTDREAPLDAEFVPTTVGRRQLGLSPHSGFLVLSFAEGVAVHRRMSRTISQGLRNRFPLIAIDGREVHVQFALEDDGDVSRERVQTVAQKIQELLPNSQLEQASIEYAPYDGPRRVVPLAVVDSSVEDGRS